MDGALVVARCLWVALPQARLKRWDEARGRLNFHMVTAARNRVKWHRWGIIASLDGQLRA